MIRYGIFRVQGDSLVITNTPVGFAIRDPFSCLLLQSLKPVDWALFSMDCYFPPFAVFILILFTVSLHLWDPVRGGPWLLAPFEIWPFSPGFLNYFIGAPQNNFPCSLNLFWYLPAPITFVNLLPELKSVLKGTIGVFLCWNAERSEAKNFYGIKHHDLHPAPGSLVVLDPILPAPENPLRGLIYSWRDTKTIWLSMYLKLVIITEATIRQFKQINIK